jgi:isoprenylcysteine carboxyl methyltransferase (ICMT) family protein YpbQ
VPENLQPPLAALRILSYFRSPHVPQILGDLMEEFNERVQSTGLSAARLWYWRATLRNTIALAAGGQMTGKARPRTLFLISGVWFCIAMLWVWLSHRWLMGLEHQAWGIVTVVVFLVYVIFVVGWLIPVLWPIIRLIFPSAMRGEHFR